MRHLTDRQRFTRQAWVASVALAIAGATTVGVAGEAKAEPAHHCASAWQHPTGHRADWCRHHDWTVRPRLTVGPHGVLHHSTLPSCRHEDGSGQRLACSWNFPHHHDGNGIGLSYWEVRGTVNYVWPVNPVASNVGPPLEWVSPELSDALAEGDPRRDGTNDWTECVVQFGPTTHVVCADGTRRSS